MGKRHFLLLPLLLALLPGCAAKFTNLTPQRLPRSATGYYPFEVAMTSQEQALKWDTIQPMVRIGEEAYPMQPMPLITNRWGAMIQLPPETEVVHYRYQFIFQSRGMGQPTKDSASSGRYFLQIVDPKPAPADAKPAPPTPPQ
jgi:hypothetical protein